MAFTEPNLSNLSQLITCEKKVLMLKQQQQSQNLFIRLPQSIGYLLMQVQKVNQFDNPYQVEQQLSEKFQHNKYVLQRIVQCWRFKNAVNVDDLGLSVKQSRCVGLFAMMRLWQGFGSGLSWLQRNTSWRNMQDDFTSIMSQILKQQIYPNSSLSTSLSICIGYSLILNDFQFHPQHIRYMYKLWFNNELGDECPNESTIGVSIYNSIMRFQQQVRNYVEFENGLQNGNGSVIRLAAVAVAYRENVQKAMLYAGLQSLTTHDGIQAMECCRLLASILVQLINRQYTVDWRLIITKACQSFISPCKEVQCLARSIKQTQDMYEKKIQEMKGLGVDYMFNNRSVEDRNWDWKSSQFTYSRTRFDFYRQEMGGYCMDALAMALHSVWHTDSFIECTMFNLKVGGNYNIVGSIAAQIAGAIYGIDKSILQLYVQTDDCYFQQYKSLLVPLQLINKKLKFNTQLESQRKKYSEAAKQYFQRQASIFYFPTSQDKPPKEIQFLQYKGFIESLNDNREIHKLIRKLKYQRELSKVLDIYQGNCVVIKKLILRDYWRKSLEKDYDDAFHGTRFKNIFSIIKYGLKKPGQKVGNLFIQIGDSHIDTCVEIDGILGYADAIFSTPSVFYASRVEYTKQFLLPINTRSLNREGWRVILQLKIKKDSYTKHKYTTVHDFPVHNQPEQIEFRNEKNDNQEVVVVAVVFIKKSLLKEQQQKLPGYYEQVTEMVLKSNEQIKMRATKYSSNVL